MRRHIALTTVLVENYDTAITFFVDKLDFKLIEDSLLDHPQKSGDPKRWVVVAPTSDSPLVGALLLAEASDERERHSIGNQAGGRVFLFLHTDDFWRDYNLYKRRGVSFSKDEPRVEEYGTVAVFEDVSGNAWDLIEPS